MWVVLVAVLAAGLSGFAPQAPVVAGVQIQGNTATPDEEVRRLADVRVGMPFDDALVEQVTARLRAAKRFESVEVRKRFASIADPSQIMLVIVVDEGPVKIVMTGDPDHPINRGTLCPKGASLQQDIVNERRLRKPQVRRPGSDRWEDIGWDTAVDEIARRVKETRDATFIEKDAQGRTVNRCEGIAWTGGCTDTNEFNYLVVKSMRSLGVTYIENQARV